jgi:hypothetical protein
MEWFQLVWNFLSYRVNLNMLLSKSVNGHQSRLCDVFEVT